MGKSTRSSGFLQHTPPPLAPDEYDAADFGTCFGLEMSLAQLESAGCAAPAEPPPITWVHRFTSLRRAH